MAAGNTHIADPVDTVHHEMDNTVHSHCVYKSMWSPVTGEQLVLKKEPAGQSVCGSDKGFSDSDPLSIGNLFTDHVVFYYMKGLCCPLSGVCHITGRMRKGKA